MGGHCKKKPVHHSEQQPRSPKLEKACMQQQRPSATKNKQIKYTEKTDKIFQIIKKNKKASVNSETTSKGQIISVIRVLEGGGQKIHLKKNGYKIFKMTKTINFLIKETQ